MSPPTSPVGLPRGRAKDQLEEVVQAGRTSSSLAAERNSSEVRASVADASRRNSSGTDAVEPEPTRPQLPTAAPSLSSSKGSYAPVKPSPLNPTSSSSSIGSDERTAAASSEVPSITPTPSESLPSHQLRLQTGKNAGIGATSPTLAQLRQSSIAGPSRGSQISLQPDTPRHLKDLGRDYSRYPFAASRRSSSIVSSAAATAVVNDSSTSLLRTETKNPFGDSEANLEKWGYPDDSIGVVDPYFGGEKGFILYKDEIEADDKYHMPADDDDLVYKPHWKEYFTRRSIVSSIGAAILVLGLFCLFILLPILTYSTHIFQNTKPLPAGEGDDYGPAWAHVNNVTYDLMKNIRKGLIDPETPDNAMTRKSTFDDSLLELVFSDEFNVPNRTFYPGDDPYWTAPDIWYGATQDMEWYSPDAVTTANGTLQLKLERFLNHGLEFRSGMLNSWNQLCFKGGVFEISASLAGPSAVPGLWPGAWTLGNLGRPGYKATTEGVWPYTYNTCDVGITPNQSDPSGLSWLPGQRLSSCTCQGEDHPNPGTGRGAPEIDILEGSVDPTNRIGVVTQSFQVAPFDNFYRPNADFMQIPNYNTTQMNGYCGGPFQQAVSGTSLLNNDWYDGKAYQKYAFEYVPGTSEGKIAWFVGEDQTFMMDGRAIGPNGNVQARHVSEEPMSMILNLGISGSWSQILMGDLRFPTVMHIDYVRIYQQPGKTSITCDPPGYPTTEYIANHPLPYNNPNITAWNETGYSWPKNTLMSGCTA